MPRHPTTIAFDLDDTIAHWGEDKSRCGDWQQGARLALRGLLETDHEVIVHTCRATWEYGGGLGEVVRFLEAGGFEVYAVGTVLGGDDDFLPEAARVGEERPSAFDWYRVGSANWWTRDEEGAEARGKFTHPVGEPVPREERGTYAVGVWVGRGKPVASWYVDDRGITHGGDWTRTLWALAQAQAGVLPGYGESTGLPAIKFEGMEPGLAIFTAAGRILAEAESVQAAWGGEEATTFLRASDEPGTDELADLIDAAGELRAAFDRWIPGWDSPEAGQSWN